MSGLRVASRLAKVCWAVLLFLVSSASWSQSSQPAQQQMTPEKLKTTLTEAGKAVNDKLYQGLREAAKKQGGVYDKVLSDNPPANPNAMTDAEKTKIREALAKAWSEAIDAPIKAALAQAESERLKTLDALGASNSKVGTVNDAFRGVRDQIKSQLEGLQSQDKIKSRLGSWDPAAADAKAKAQEIFEKLASDLSTALAEEWGRGEGKVVGGLAGPSTGEQIAEKQAEIQKILTTNETEYYQELRKETGFSRVVRCVWGSNPTALACKPDLRISAADVAEIVISNLPSDKTVVVTALTAEEILPATWDTEPKDKNAQAQAAFDLQVAKLRSTLANVQAVEISDEDLAQMPEPTCPKPSGATGYDWRYLSCDEVTFSPGQSGTILVGVYKGRRIRPIYGGFIPKSEKAFETLRGSTNRKGLSLLISGSVSQILVRVRVDNTLATTTIPIGYERWGFETGGFFAATKLTDEKLIQQTNSTAADAEKVEVLRVTDAEKISQETGIFLNFIPRNYPSLGLGVGFSAASGKPLSTYFGPSFRLRSFGQRGIANFSTGLAMRSVKRFPGVDSGDRFPLGSPLLTGQDEYHVAPYFLLQLGFSFGPIPGPEEKAKGTGASTGTSGGN